MNRVIFSLTKHVVTKDSKILHHLNYDNIFLNHYLYRYIWYIINMNFPHKLTKLWSLALPNELASAEQFTVATHQIFLHVRWAIMQGPHDKKNISTNCPTFFFMFRVFSISPTGMNNGVFVQVWTINLEVCAWYHSQCMMLVQWWNPFFLLVAHRVFIFHPSRTFYQETFSCFVALKYNYMHCNLVWNWLTRFYFFPTTDMSRASC